MEKIKQTLIYLFHPCQRKIDAAMADFTCASAKLSDAIMPRVKNDFSHVEGRTHVNPR